MKALVLTPELATVARRVMWFEEPDQAIAIPSRFLAHVMTQGNIADMGVIRRQLSEADLLEAITDAPAGIFDGPSWTSPMPDGFFDTSNARRSGTIGEFDQGLDANGFPR